MENSKFIKSVVEAIQSNLDAIRSLQEDKKDMTFAETAQIFLMDKLGYTQIQAQEVYEELGKGLAEYTAQQEAIQADSSVVASSIIAATAGYSPEERTRIYVNVLTSLQLIDKTNEEADVETLRAKNSSLSDDELVKAVINALDGLPFQYVLDEIKDGITPEAISIIGGAKDMRTQDFKQAVALILYVAQKEGTISLATEDSDVSPRIIGAMAGAGADAMSATADLQDGKLDVAMWHTVLKSILGALFTVVFAAVCTFAILALNTLIAAAILSVFGHGLIATLLVIPALFYFTKNAIKTSEEEYDKLKGKLYPIYDSLIEHVTLWAKTVVDKIKAWMQMAREKAEEVSSRLTSSLQHENDGNNVVGTAPMPA